MIGNNFIEKPGISPLPYLKIAGLPIFLQAICSHSGYIACICWIWVRDREDIYLSGFFCNVRTSWQAVYHTNHSILHQNFRIQLQFQFQRFQNSLGI